MGTISEFVRRSLLVSLPCLWLMISLEGGRNLWAQSDDIPQVLQPWKDWVLWEVDGKVGPSPFNDPNKRLKFWPSELQLEIFPDRASFQLGVRVFDESWVPLPGDSGMWPQEVESQEGALPVLLREGHPSIRLAQGTHRIRGKFPWSDVPQKIMLPKTIGIVSLRRDNALVPEPLWDDSGFLWLSRQPIEKTEQNLLAAKVYRLLEDGIPLWLRTEVDLSVSGKSREEDLGTILPEGWQLSSIEGSVPVAIDDQGKMLVQVRPGNWKIEILAFRTRDFAQFQFAEGSRPTVATELIGFKPNPSLRIAELEGLSAIDVQQTTFPEAWRAWPVFQWPTQSRFHLSEKLRGMGAQEPKGFSIVRNLWLDDDGRGITFQDLLQGEVRQSWRLDVAESHQLGVVRIGKERQLITENPLNGNHGVELRSRFPELQALGRIDRSQNIPATGWLADVDTLRWTISLPPGYRMLTVFGADRVEGDWLTAWSLLDLFLVLIFAMAVYRLWGIPAGLLALVAFGLSYHEPGSPRWTWLFLLMPIALLRVVEDGAARRWLEVWRYLALGLILLNLVPFIASQVQTVLYPQLERTGVPYQVRPMFPWLDETYQTSANLAESMREDASTWTDSPSSAIDKSKEASTVPRIGDAANLSFDPSSRTQTGPAKPEWFGNAIQCQWDGPVTAEQRVNPVYISRTFHRVLSVVRCVLLLLLVALLFRMRSITSHSRTRKGWLGQSATALMLVCAILPADQVWGQFPTREMLDSLRERLLKPSDAFPNAATIADLSITVQENKLLMALEVHAATEVALPLPGKLPHWSPVSVHMRRKDAPRDETPSTQVIEGSPSMYQDLPKVAICRREDGYLWMVVPEGIHLLTVEGILTESNEWVLAFPLVPKRVALSAQQWQVIGIGANAVPENQLFFSRVEKRGTGDAKYDQRIYRPVVMVERRLELGLNWKVKTTVSRLSSPGKAIALKIPLIAGERVLSTHSETVAGTIDVNLASGQQAFSWSSELELAERIVLSSASGMAGEEASSSNGDYVERWILVSSPVWNITANGVSPIFESNAGELMPVWNVWPGEKVELDIRRPQAVVGESLTVRRARHWVSLGARQSSTILELELESSLGGDFYLDVDSSATITSLSIDKRSQSIRRKESQLIVSLQPGIQQVEIQWAFNRPLGVRYKVDAVKLPVQGANITTGVIVPENRWILWASGPMRGPAVRMWVFLFTSILVAFFLGGLRFSPLARWEWILLALGLTQLHAIAGLFVVAWLLLLGWRGQIAPQSLVRWRFNVLQGLLVFMTIVTLGILVVVVGKGLLGSPEMFIVGNGSYGNQLNWYEPQTEGELSRPAIFSVSIWFYRLAMLLWALWLAIALLQWLQTGWHSFSKGGRWRPRSEIFVAESLSESSVEPTIPLT